jgi:hypothetical protein
MVGDEIPFVASCPSLPRDVAPNKPRDAAEYETLAAPNSRDVAVI